MAEEKFKVGDWVLWSYSGDHTRRDEAASKSHFGWRRIDSIEKGACIDKPDRYSVSGGIQVHGMYISKVSPEEQELLSAAYPGPVDKVEKLPEPKPVPAPKPSWTAHAAREKAVAADQAAVDAEARIRRAREELDRPTTPKYPRVLLMADICTSWSNRR